MKLAFVTQDFPPELGGIQTYSFELANRFSEMCDEFILIAPDNPDAAVIDKKLAYPVYRIHASNPLLGVRGIFEAPGIFQKHAIDTVFHAQWQTLAASVRAQQRGIVEHIFTAVHARELVFNPFQSIPGIRWLYEFYKRKMLAEVNFCFPVSDYMSEVLQLHGVEPSRIEVVINGTNPDRFHAFDVEAARKEVGIHSKKILLSVSRLVSKKGIDTTLKAFAGLRQHHPDSTYVIIGEGEDQPALKQLAFNLGIADSVEFAGSVSHDDSKLVSYYNACDVFVMPSKTEDDNVEGCPIVYLEANACEKPVIGTFSSGIPSAIIDGETGMLVEENDHKKLAEAIDHLFSNPGLAHKMGKNGRKRVEREANWDAVAQKLYRRMCEVIRRKQWLK